MARAIAWAAFVWLLLGVTQPAVALTICSGPCPTQPPPSGGSITVAPGLLPPVVAVPDSNIVMVPSGGDFSQSFDSDVLVGVPAGGIQLHDLTLDAVGSVFVAQQAQFHTSGALNLLAGVDVRLCTANDCAGAGTGSNPTLVLLQSVAGDVSIGSLGDISVFALPEGSTSWLLLLGGLAAAGSQRRARRT